MQFLEILGVTLIVGLLLATIAIVSYRLREIHLNNKREREEENLRVFKSNFIKKVTDSNKELILMVESLLEESHELILRSNVTTEEVDQLIEGSEKMRTYMHQVMDILSSDNDDEDEAIASMTLFNSQLSTMVGAIDDNINKLKESLGIERIIN